MASQPTKKPAPWQVTRRETPQQTPQQQLSRKRKITEGGSVVAPSEIDEGGPWGSRSNSQSQSQGQTESQAGVSELNKIVKSMTEDRSKRYQANKKKLYTDYDKSVSETQAAITDLFDNHESQAAKAHESQMNHLRTLIKEKQKLEAEMQKRFAHLREQFLRHSSVFELALERRVKDLS